MWLILKQIIITLNRFILNLKLFIVMGLSWIFEITATIFDKHHHLWMVTDFVNLMQGVLIFFIFVCKRKVLMAFQKKLGKLFINRIVSYMLYFFVVVNETFQLPKKKSRSKWARKQAITFYINNQILIQTCKNSYSMQQLWSGFTWYCRKLEVSSTLLS